MSNNREEFESYIDSRCERGIKLGKVIRVLFYICLGFALVATLDPTDWSKIAGRDPITGKTSNELMQGWFGKCWDARDKAACKAKEGAK